MICLASWKRMVGISVISGMSAFKSAISSAQCSLTYAITALSMPVSIAITSYIESM